jgi:cytochrome c oxidase subunit II
VTDTRREFDDLFFSLYLPLMVAVTVIVAALVAFALLRRRDRPSPRRESKLGEAMYAVVLALIAAILVGFTFRTEARVDRVSGDARVEIAVTAFQWGWRFAYPGGRVVVGNDRTLPVLVVPAGERVRFRLTSRDVIHAFWVPALRFKRDAFPRRETRFDLVFREPGSLPGSCAEFCGLRHADMRFGVRVVSRGEFESWLRERA